MSSVPKPKTSLGRYQLVRHLATGGMADVLVARVDGIEGFERHVVVKQIRPEQARDKRFVEMFLDEARLAASLHHHNIVTVHDIGQENGEYFFAMEYVHGEDLRKLLAHASEREQMVPYEHAITIVSCAAAALHYAHEARGQDRKPLGLVHRDVSPANILVAYDGNVKVVDFGIAKATHRAEDTQVGTMKGKVAYMSPEQCMGLPIDRRSDIFCLGILLYELVTVRRLFKGENDYTTMRSITDGVIPRPSEIRPDISPVLESIIMKALAQEPSQRYQTADEMRAALERFAARAGLHTSTNALGDYMHQQFGEPPMPWQLDEDECEMELSYDFDGAARPVVQVPQDPTVPPSLDPASPLGRARTKAITGAPEPSGALAQDSLMPLVQSGPVVAAGPQTRIWQRKRLMFGGIAIAAIANALLVVSLATGSESGGVPASFITPPPLPQVAPAPAPRPVTPPNLMSATPVATPVTVKKPVKTSSSTAATSATSSSAATSGSTHKKTTAPAPTPTRGTWDPDTLFPKKK